MGLAPWHMWGNAETVVLKVGAVSTTPPAIAQVARINYARPEFWRFLFSARITEVALPAPLPAGTINIAWNLTVGVGRSQLTLKPFGLMLFSWPALSTPQGQLFATEFRAIQQFTLNATGPPTIVDAPVSGFVAQDIQLEAVASISSPALSGNVTLELYGSFAPNVHVRPEWFSRVGLFPGGEASGK